MADLKVVFLGVGEAYDENLINNSHLILSKERLLLDCGYSVPRQLWRTYPDQNFLDAIYLSHAHMDHYMGVPILLARMQDETRTKPLRIICEADTRTSLLQLIEYAHGNLRGKIGFPLQFIEIDSQSQISLGELELKFARTQHSIENLAIKVCLGNKIICYSGDGELTVESINLYRGADLLVHESFTLEAIKNGHASVKNVVEKCSGLGIKNLALTHLSRTLRAQNLQAVLDYIASVHTNMHIFVPEQLDEFNL